MHNHSCFTQVEIKKVSMLRRGVRTMLDWKDTEGIRRMLCCSKVTLGPSNVSGMGVFTTKYVKKGDTVCIYSGKLVLGTPEKKNMSKYIVEGYQKDEAGNKKQCHLDAGAKDSAVGMYINDACDYDGNERSVPEKFKTQYGTNVKYGYVIIL